MLLSVTCAFEQCGEANSRVRAMPSLAFSKVISLISKEFI